MSDLETRRNALWTSEEDARLLALRAEGATVPRIAALLGRPVGSVYLRARKLGSQVMTYRTWTPEEDARLRALFETDATTDGEIAAELGRSISSIRWRLSALSLIGSRPRVGVGTAASKPRRPRAGDPRGWSEAEIETLRELAASGLSIAEAAARLGRGAGGLRVKAREHGIAFRNALTLEAERRREAIRAAWNEAPPEEIAARLGLSAATVRDMAGKIGLVPRRRRATAVERADDETVLTLAREGLTIGEIARRARRDARTIRLLLAAAGIEPPRRARRVEAAAPRPRKARTKTVGTAKTEAAPRAVSKPPAGISARPAAPIPAATAEAPRKAATPDRLETIRRIAERMRREGRLPA